MKILQHDDIKLTLDDLKARQPIQRPPQPPKRAHGVHLSGVLKQWALEKEILALSEWEEEEGGYPLLWMLGQAVEEFWASLMVGEGMIWQPGELQRDGVSGNPDGLSRLLLPVSGQGSVSHLVIEEHKVTKKSCRDNRDVPGLANRQAVCDWWSRLSQVQSYCAMHPSRPRLARFHVFYVNADYKGIEPKYRRTLVEFSDYELQSNWDNIRKFAKRTKPE